MIAGIASDSVTANFMSKNGLCIAVITSGRTPRNVAKIRIENGAATSSAIVSIAPTRGARWALSAASVRMS